MLFVFNVNSCKENKSVNSIFEFKTHIRIMHLIDDSLNSQADESLSNKINEQSKHMHNPLMLAYNPADHIVSLGQ